MEDISNRIDCVRHVIKCIPNYEQLQALEVGCGIGDKSFFLSHDFAEYSVMEPNKIAYDVFIKKSSELGCTIQAYNMDFNTFQTENPDKKYDVIIFIFSFHFMNKKDIIEQIMKSVKDHGYVIIHYPSLTPYQWSNEEYNKTSHQFNQQKWEKRKSLLQEYVDIIQSSKYLMRSVMDIYSVPYIELYPNHTLDTIILNSSKVYVLQKS